MSRNLPPRIQSHIARAQRRRFIATSLFGLCVLVGTGAALAQTQLPHQLVATLRPIASALATQSAQLPSALSARMPEIDLQLPTTQLAAASEAATSFSQSLAQEFRNLFCRWFGCDASQATSRISNENIANIEGQQHATNSADLKQPAPIPQTSPSDVARSATTEPAAVSNPSPPSPAPARQQQPPERIIERIREVQVALPDTTYVDARLAALRTALEQRIASMENANATSFRSASSGSSPTSVAASAITGTITSAIDTASAAISSLTATELVAIKATTTNLYVSGTATIGSGTGLLQSNSGVLSALANGSNGQVLKVVGGALAWSSDLTGGGGASSAWSTTTDDLALYPADTTDVVLVGTSATSTTGNILEVSGNSLLRGNLTAYNSITAPTFTATSSAATSTFPRLNVSGSLGLGSDYITDLTGSGLTLTSGTLTLDTSGTWSGNLSGYTAAQLLAGAFSTSSADVWKQERNFFSTTSADYWETQQTARTADDLSNNSIEDLSDVAAITENYGDLFYWNGAAWADIATSSLAINTTNLVEGSNLFFTDARVQSFIHASSTIPKTYTANTFSALQTFANASTSILSASTLCLSTDCRTTWPSAGNSFDYLFPANATTTTLTFNAGLLSVGSTTIAGNATTTGMFGMGSLFLNNSRFTSLLGSGLLNSSGVLTLDTSGNWSGTLGGYTSSQLLAAAFSTSSADIWKDQRNFFATTSADYWKSVTDLFPTSSAIYFAHSSTTIPKTYTANAWTGSNVFSALTLGSLNGPLHANAGVLSATTSIGVLYGGTGLTSAPTYGQVLVGNSSGGYTLTATSSLGLPTFAYPFPNNATSTGLGIYASSTIGNGTQAGGLTINGGATTTGSLVVQGTATSTFAGGLQAAALNITSTGASSTFANGVNLSGGCFSILGTCLGSGSASQWTTSGSDIYYSTGNIGIGTTTPWAQLSVNPNGISGPAFAVGSSTATKFVITNSGNVGVGKATPGYPLDVIGDINFTGGLREDGNEIFANMIAPFAGSCPTGWSEYTAARGRTVVGTPSGGTNVGTVGSALSDLGTRTITDVASHLHTVDPPGTNTNTDGAHTHSIDLGTSDNLSPNTADGSFGGGSGSASTGSAGSHSHSVDIAQFNSGSTGVASVDVTMPYIQLTYCQKAAGADIAEWIPASEDIEKATIISTDPENRERVVASRKEYDNSVVGVVATQPGWLLGQETKESVQMALAGRVPMRVSLKNGEIKIGDPITTSSIPGVGMKATKAGPIVGKAMEAVNETSALTSCTDPMTGRAEKCATALVIVNISWYSPTVAAGDDVALLSASRYYEPLSIGYDFETGDVVTVQYRYPQKQGTPSETAKTGYLMPAMPGSVVAGVISTEIGGPGELLRRVRENNRIVSELRLVESGKADMRIAADSEAVEPGDGITISPEHTGAGTKATSAGFIAGRALEAWEPGDTKTISVMLDASWYVPPIEEIAHEHDEESGYDDHFFSNIFARIIAWLADAKNGIENLFAKNLYATNGTFENVATKQLCAIKSDGSQVCLTGDQLGALLSQTGGAATAVSVPSSPSIPSEAEATSTPPELTQTEDEAAPDLTYSETAAHENATPEPSPVPPPAASADSQPPAPAAPTSPPAEPANANIPADSPSSEPANDNSSAAETSSTAGAS